MWERKEDMFSHSPQSSASHHMDKEGPQLKVHIPPHHGLSLPGWRGNSKLFKRPKREPRATQPAAPQSRMKDASHQLKTTDSHGQNHE